MPYDLQKSYRIHIFLNISSLVVDSTTVPSIMNNTWSHDRNLSRGQPCLIICIIVFTYMTKSTHDVGQPCRMPTVVRIKSYNIIFILIHSSCFIHVNKFILGTQSYARLKSINVTNNFHFFLLTTFINNLSGSRCSVQPCPAWLPTCSRYGTNQ